MRMVDRPLVFVNVLIWNGERWLKKCLDSVLATQYPNFKVTVIDNNSSDNSRKIIEESYPQVTLIKNRKNFGFAEGHNIGIRYALKQNAEYIVLLNQDIIVDKFWLAELVDVAQMQNEFAILTLFQYDYEGKKIDPHFLSRLLLNSKEFKNDYEQGLNLKKVYEHSCPFGAAMLIKKEVFLKVGLFDPFFFVYHEERDLLQRCFFYGFKMALVTSSRINHWHSSLHPEKMPLRVKYLSDRNNYIAILKNPQELFLRNLITCFKWTGKFILENLNSWRGFLRIFFATCLQLEIIFYFPIILLKRFQEKRKPCYL